MKTEVHGSRVLHTFVEAWDGQHAGWCVVEIVECAERDVSKSGRLLRVRTRIEVKRGEAHYANDSEAKRDPTLTQSHAIHAALRALEDAQRVLITAAREQPNWVWKKKSIYAEKKR